MNLPNAETLFETLAERIKPIIALNKSDLADPQVTSQWMAHYVSERDVTVLPLSSV